MHDAWAHGSDEPERARRAEQEPGLLQLRKSSKEVKGKALAPNFGWLVLGCIEADLIIFTSEHSFCSVEVR